MTDPEDQDNADLERARMRLWSDVVIAAMPLQLEQRLSITADAILHEFDKRFGEKDKG